MILKYKPLKFNKYMDTKKQPPQAKRLFSLSYVLSV